MGLDFQINLNETLTGNYRNYNTSTPRTGVTVETTTYLNGKHDWHFKPLGPTTERGSRTQITSPNGTKVHYTTPDGARLIAKESYNLNRPYKKILYKPNTKAPWELIAYSGGDFSFTNINKVQNLPEIMDVTSGNAKVKANWNMLNIGTEFKGFKAGLPGLTLKQFKNVQKFFKVLKQLL